MTMTNSKKRGRCLECGNEIAYGRSDKKFCSAACKSRYHNRSGSSAKIRYRILSALNRNYHILEGLLKMGVKTITNSELGQLGYNHEYVTSSTKVRGHNEVSCFDIRYFRSETKIFNIHRAAPLKILADSPDNV